MNRHFASTLTFAATAAAIACAAAMASSSAYAETPTIDTTPFVSTRSRAEVQADLMRHRRTGAAPPPASGPCNTTRVPQLKSGYTSAAGESPIQRLAR